MKHYHIFLTALFGLGATTAAAATVAKTDTIAIADFSYQGPVELKLPMMVDSIDANSKSFNQESLLDLPVGDLKRLGAVAVANPAITPGAAPAIHLLNFRIDNQRYFEGKIKVDSLAHFALMVDGKKLQGDELVLTPASHELTIKCLTLSTDSAAQHPRVTITGPNGSNLRINPEGNKLMTLNRIMEGRRYHSASLSPSGRYLLTISYDVHPGGQATYRSVVTELASGAHVADYPDLPSWMPKTDKLYATVTAGADSRLVERNPATGEQRVLVEKLPSPYFTLSPNADFLIYNAPQAVPGEKRTDLYEIMHPEDRQPGWRNRYNLMKYDIATGVASPLTFGNRYASVLDISDDGRQAIISVRETAIEQRPSELMSGYILDLATLKVDTLFERKGFMASLSFAPDGKTIAAVGSPEAFDGAGLNLPEGMTPNMYDYQLFAIDTATKRVTPLTRDFNPSIDNVKWNHSDGQIYFTAMNGDRCDLYRCDPASGRITPLNAREENVVGFSMARTSPDAVYIGKGESNSDRLYAFSTSSRKGASNAHHLIEDLSAERYGDVKLSKAEGWKFRSSRGDSISCFYVVPPDFDLSAKYPMIVNYYGGCHPTTRNMETRYPHQLYAANGYVVLVVNPSGAAGFGQEHAARHVNTAGEGVADDIIEATTKFTAEHPWVNAERIGCIGASYGGFMTQYLQTKTDIFAAAISHAGISSHTSYWGEGYWGYSYSEVSMANTYPWSHRDLYVGHSPLYNADKIHTPILFLHGDSDTNVPFGESIQMYTALRRLGRPTAFVAVRDANHQVTEYDKRLQWQETIFAWFAKYLQDDPAWWEHLYPAKPLK